MPGGTLSAGIPPFTGITVKRGFEENLIECGIDQSKGLREEMKPPEGFSICSGLKM